MKGVNSVVKGVDRVSYLVLCVSAIGRTSELLTSDNEDASVFTVQRAGID